MAFENDHLVFLSRVGRGAISVQSLCNCARHLKDHLSGIRLQYLRLLTMKIDRFIPCSAGYVSMDISFKLSFVIFISIVIIYYSKFVLTFQKTLQMLLVLSLLLYLHKCLGLFWTGFIQSNIFDSHDFQNRFFFLKLCPFAVVLKLSTVWVIGECRIAKVISTSQS